MFEKIMSVLCVYLFTQKKRK